MQGRTVGKERWRRVTGLTLGLGLLAGGCRSGSPPAPIEGGEPLATAATSAPEAEQASPASADAAPRVGEGTRRMAHQISRVIAGLDPARTPWLASRRARLLEQVPLPTDPLQRMAYRAQLGSTLLGAGRTREAVETLSALADEVRERSDGVGEQTRHDILMLLAAANLRLGEEENCAANHNADSCLLPIQGGGQHQLREGSERAAAVLAEVLEAAPEDLEARWLANIAAMTLGEYPAGLPEAWRIPPERFASEDDIGRFYDVAPAAGLATRGLSGGAVTEDFDGDGLLDLMVSSWGIEDPLQLMRSQGDGHFEDIAEAAGIAALTGGLNLIQADYDNDGLIDVLVLRGAWMGSQGEFPNSLLHNLGGGRFEDVTEAAGLLSYHPTQTASWGDYDGDGWIDLFIGNETQDQGQPGAGTRHPGELYRNLGDGTFREVAAEEGLEVLGWVKGVTWFDMDNDDRLDLYVSRLGQANLLFRNRGPAASGGRFEEIAAAAGVAEPEYSFPVWAWDYDNDGWQDLMVLGYGHAEDFLGGCADDVAADVLGLPGGGSRPRLYRNRGDGRFEDRTETAGVNDVLFAMGSNFGDLDNDGWLDFYVGTGDPAFTSLVPNRMYRADGAGHFLDVTSSGGFGHLQKGHAIAFADLDNDGDQDVFANLGGAAEGDWYYNALFENPGQGQRWITLRLVGETANRSAIGTRIALVVEGPEGRREIHRTVSSGGSFGASSLQQEIGLGRAEAIVELRLRWPASGLDQRFEGLPLDRVLEIREGAEGWREIQAPRIDLPEPDFEGHGHMSMDEG
ncbi:MAG: CRTAC1 family protein [Caldilineae bacterium]|nr:CRTAC1 family protein [Caldilineae bacterium]